MDFSFPGLFKLLTSGLLVSWNPLLFSSDGKVWGVLSLFSVGRSLKLWYGNYQVSSLCPFSKNDLIWLFYFFFQGDDSLSNGAIYFTPFNIHDFSSSFSANSAFTVPSYLCLKSFYSFCFSWGRFILFLTQGIIFLPQVLLQ